MRALTSRVEWLKARAGTFQVEVTDRSAWDWYADSCSCGLPPGECRAHPRARPTHRPPAGDWRVWAYVAGRGAGKDAGRGVLDSTSGRQAGFRFGTQPRCGGAGPVSTEPALTIRSEGSYDRVKPILLTVYGPNGAIADVSRAIPLYSDCGCKVLLCGLLCLLGAVNTSQAAGCHIQDRIVLGSTPSWEKELIVDLSPKPVIQLPPVLAEPPCHGEVAHVVDFDGTGTGAALVHSLPFDHHGPSHFVSVQSPSEPVGPRLAPLDRPPRANLSAQRPA
jgi:hypothetical protein